MVFNQFSMDEQYHINGVIAQYMDTYIRRNLVWTPEQMYLDFIEYLQDLQRNNWFSHKVGSEWIFPMKAAQQWMISEDSREFIVSRFTNKYEKNKKLARKKSPLVERVRFGHKWDESKFYDINFGLKGNGFDNEKTEIVENFKIVPWSVTHVENQLLLNHSTFLRNCFDKLSTSPIEKLFYEYWLKHFYDPENPAIIPEICGERSLYYCHKNGNNYSLNRNASSHSLNVRFDFGIINFNKQSKLLIELDGHETHKTVEQRNNDAIKRTIATNNGWHLNVITGTQIYRNIDECFDSIKAFLLPRN